jgi:hypothetical protein
MWKGPKVYFTFTVEINCETERTDEGALALGIGEKDMSIDERRGLILSEDS